MRIPSYNKSEKRFWDKAKLCVSKLMHKGFGQTFGFDWHHRQEDAGTIRRTRYQCPAKYYMQ